MMGEFRVEEAVGPILRGLTYDGRCGRIVEFVPEVVAEVAAGATEDSSAIALEEALNEGSNEVSDDGAVLAVLREALERHPVTDGPAVVRVRGSGSFRIGPRSKAPMDRNNVVAGKVAVVTGGARGIGAELVRHLHSGGAHVCVADIDFDAATELARELDSDGDGDGRAQAIGCAVDVSNEESVAKLVGTVVSRWGGIDILVSNAGILVAGPVAEMDAESFRRVTDVNYTAFFLLVKHVSPVMRRQHLAGAYVSDIVEINSKSGLVGSSRNSAYAGSKFGGIGLTQSFALELVEFGIKVNAICPGNYLDGPLWTDPDRGLFVQYLRAGKVPGARTVDDVRRYYERRVPMGRGVAGSDIARALFYVVEQEYETGQAIPVSGGQVMLA